MFSCPYILEASEMIEWVLSFDLEYFADIYWDWEV